MNMLLLALQASLCLLAQASPAAVPIFDVHVTNQNPSIEIPIEIRNLFPKIVGGVDATPNEYPFMVQLAVNWANGGSGCGASIINADYVLTAAHCVYNKDEGWATPSNIYMFLGKHDYNVNSGNYDQLVTGVQIYANNYNPGQNINDIAIIRVNRKIQMNSKVQPICLASGTNTYADRTGTVMGWGVTKYGYLPNNGVQATEPQFLQKINMYILSAQTCSQAGSQHTTPDKVCIYDLNNTSKGVCSGDSGGPLVVNENGKYVQVGIASYITGPCGTQAISVYARVTYFKSFIQQVVGAGTYSTC
jgi:secreted trypsin-like serine protease